MRAAPSIGAHARPRERRGGKLDAARLADNLSMQERLVAPQHPGPVSRLRATRPISQTREAVAFYATLMGSIPLALAVGQVGIPPIRLLFISSIAGGLGTP
jgi:hypothetical protein